MRGWSAILSSFDLGTKRRVLEFSVRGAGTAFDVIDRTITQHRITVKGSALTARRFCFKLLLVLDSYVTPGLSGLTGSQHRGRCQWRTHMI